MNMNMKPTDVAAVVGVIDPDAKADADGYRQVRQAVTRSIGASR
mgnify:CR=1 FL=1